MMPAYDNFQGIIIGIMMANPSTTQIVNFDMEEIHKGPPWKCLPTDYIYNIQCINFNI